MVSLGGRVGSANLFPALVPPPEKIAYTLLLERAQPSLLHQFIQNFCRSRSGQLVFSGRLRGGFPALGDLPGVGGLGLLCGPHDNAPIGIAVFRHPVGRAGLPADTRHKSLKKVLPKVLPSNDVLSIPQMSFTIEVRFSGGGG